MVDFTGGCSEVYDLTKDVPKNLFNIMKKTHDRKSLNCCSIAPDPYKFEAKTKMGLIRGHAYSITKVNYKIIKDMDMCESKDIHKPCAGSAASSEGEESLGK